VHVGDMPETANNITAPPTARRQRLWCLCYACCRCLLACCHCYVCATVMQPPSPKSANQLCCPPPRYPLRPASLLLQYGRHAALSAARLTSSLPGLTWCVSCCRPGCPASAAPPAAQQQHRPTLADTSSAAGAPGSRSEAATQQAVTAGSCCAFILQQQQQQQNQQSTSL